MKKLLIILMLMSSKLDSAVPVKDLPEIVITPEPWEPYIYELFVEQGIDAQMAAILVAQAKHETGNFSSDLFVYHNNLFGMQHPRRRKTTSLGPIAKAEGRGNYASYRSIEDAVIDFTLYLKARNIPCYTSIPLYVKHLKKKNYFEDTYNNYVKALQRNV